MSVSYHIMFTGFRALGICSCSFRPPWVVRSSDFILVESPGLQILLTRWLEFKIPGALEAAQLNILLDINDKWNSVKNS